MYPTKIPSRKRRGRSLPRLFKKYKKINSEKNRLQQNVSRFSFVFQDKCAESPNSIERRMNDDCSRCKRQVTLKRDDFHYSDRV